MFFIYQDDLFLDQLVLSFRKVLLLDAYGDLPFLWPLHCAFIIKDIEKLIL